ncbi:MAG: orotate phosphoribosyltransferase, partial [Frankiaceae bacterium]|nr:orotate phosphoribosyltransferase [Frankiaceae bacterium]
MAHRFAHVSDREDLQKLIVDEAVVRGKVTLASGREADYYLDLRRITL